jgi:hypothetical protein
MAEYKAITLNSQKTSGGAYGNTVTFVNDVTPTTFNTADNIKVLAIPAGTFLTEIFIDTDDLDSNGTPTAAAKIGYVNKDGTAAPSGADTIFGTAINTWQTGGRVVLRFKPFAVTRDIYLTIVPTTNAATYVAGKINAVATGILTNA